MPSTRRCSRPGWPRRSSAATQPTRPGAACRRHPSVRGSPPNAWSAGMVRPRPGRPPCARSGHSSRVRVRRAAGPCQGVRRRQRTARWRPHVLLPVHRPRPSTIRHRPYRRRPRPVCSSTSRWITRFGYRPHRTATKAMSEGHPWVRFAHRSGTPARSDQPRAPAGAVRSSLAVGMGVEAQGANPAAARPTWLPTGRPTASQAICAASMRPSTDIPVATPISPSAWARSSIGTLPLVLGMGSHPVRRHWRRGRTAHVRAPQWRWRSRGHVCRAGAHRSAHRRSNGPARPAPPPRWARRHRSCRRDRSTHRHRRLGERPRRPVRVDVVFERATERRRQRHLDHRAGIGAARAETPNSSIASSVPMPALCRLWVSLTDTTYCR